MAISEIAEDQPTTRVNGQLPYNIYLYWYDGALPDTDGIPFSHASTLVSAQYTPYFKITDFDILKIPYDKSRFGYDADKEPNVYRIKSFVDRVMAEYTGTIEKTLGSFKCYAPNKSIGGSRSWRNESKLYNYPYTLGYLYDGLCEPIEVKFENCPSNTVTVKTRLALNINGDYSLFIEGYHNDTTGQMEQNVVTSSRDYPCSSSQYASWLATNKNQIQATVNNSAISSIQSIATGIIGGAVTGATGGGMVGSIVPGAGTGVGAIGGGLVGAIGGGINALSSLMKTNNNLQAQEKDMRNLPPTLISRGSDLTLGINTTNQKLKLFKYRQKDEYMTKIGDFFAMYGYKQNRIMKVDTRNRHYYNYIKTVGCNISSSAALPIFANEVIKSIFDNGVTIWHIDRSGVSICDYSKDNYEV